MIKSFNPIKSRRPWPPILISHLFQQGPFSSWPLLFLHLGCFCLDYIKLSLCGTINNILAQSATVLTEPNWRKLKILPKTLSHRPIVTFQ